MSSYKKEKDKINKLDVLSDDDDDGEPMKIKINFGKSEDLSKLSREELEDKFNELKDDAEDLEDEVDDLSSEVDDLNGEIEDLNDQISELKEQLDELNNNYARAYADTENMRKRLQNEADIRQKYRIQSFASEILPVIDNLERALSQEVNETNEAFYKGVDMIYKQLIEALKKEGVAEIEALNKDFDPNFHQAILTEKVEGEKPGKVIQVLQKGYMLKDRILRASMVKVSE